MTRRLTPQEESEKKAHQLLLEWGSGPGEGVPEDKQVHDRVHGGERPLSQPERYAQLQGRWHRLDTAVQRTHEQNPDLGRAIWWVYGEGLSLPDCVGLMVGKDPRAEGEERLTTEDWQAWRARRKTACELFLRHYEMLCAQMGRSTSDCGMGLTAGNRGV